MSDKMQSACKLIKIGDEVEVIRDINTENAPATVPGIGTKGTVVYIYNRKNKKYAEVEFKEISSGAIYDINDLKIVG